MPTQIYGPSCEGLSATNVQEYLTAAKGVVTGVTVHNYPMARDCNVTAYLGAKKNVQVTGFGCLTTITRSLPSGPTTSCRRLSPNSLS
jgi:hypothetical protein